MPRFGHNIFTSRLFVESEQSNTFGYDIYSRGLFASQAAARQIGLDVGSAGGLKLTAAFAVDGVGDLKSPVLLPTLLITPDNYQPVESAWYIPGPTALIDVYTPDANTTGTLVVDDPNHVIAACDTPGDNDWFAVTLTAGETYQFGQYAYAGGIPGAEGNGVPLADAYLEIYDSAGNLLAIADGGGPNTPSGLDALMTFEAPYSGTFYVNATSYDNTGDGVGDFAGDYEIFAMTATGTTYTTHYDISSPLHSIDWGGVLVNREHVSVRNPDGMEGPRPTGEPAADPADRRGQRPRLPGQERHLPLFRRRGRSLCECRFDHSGPGHGPESVSVRNPGHADRGERILQGRRCGLCLQLYIEPDDRPLRARPDDRVQARPIGPRGRRQICHRSGW